MPNSHSGIVAFPLKPPPSSAPAPPLWASLMTSFQLQWRRLFSCSAWQQQCDTATDTSAATDVDTAIQMQMQIHLQFVVRPTLFYECSAQITASHAKRQRNNTNNNNRNRNVRLSDTFVSAYLRPCNRRGVSVAEHFRPLRMRAAV